MEFEKEYEYHKIPEYYDFYFEYARIRSMALSRSKIAVDTLSDDYHKVDSLNALENPDLISELKNEIDRVNQCYVSLKSQCVSDIQGLKEKH